MRQNRFAAIAALVVGLSFGSAFAADDAKPSQPGLIDDTRSAQPDQNIPGSMQTTPNQSTQPGAVDQGNPDMRDSVRQRGMTPGQQPGTYPSQGFDTRGEMIGPNGLGKWDDAKTPADQDLIRRIRTALSGDQQVASGTSDLRFNAKNGKVTLKGTVGSEEEKIRINSLVTDVVGGGNLKNRLKVKKGFNARDTSY